MNYTHQHGIKRLLLLLFSFAGLQVSVATNYYVSNSGSDLNNGTSLATPFKTIQKAADKVIAGETVFIRGGVYREEVNITKSGQNGKPIVFKNYNSEEVVVTTTDLLGGWSSYSGNIYRTSFNSNIMGRKNMTLFIDDEWINEAHWSSNGKNVDMLDAADFGVITSHTENTLTDPNLTSFSNDYWNDASVYIQTNSWSFTPRKVVDFIGSTGTIIVDESLSFSGKQGLKYFIFESLKALDSPGEWYFDENINQLFVWAPNGGNPNSLKTEVKTRTDCFNLNGNDFVSFSGIHLKGGDIKMANSNNILLEWCHISYPDWDYGVGSNKVVVPSLAIDGSYNVIRNNEIEGVCGRLINLNGEYNHVVNNYFHDLGFNNVDGAVIDIENCGIGNLISHNTIDRVGHSAIAGPSGYKFVIQYNEISNTCLITADVGAIGLGNSSYNNSIIHHNVFHGMAAMSAGVYMDANSSDIVIHNNIFYDGVTWGLKINMPSNNILSFNNTIYKRGMVDGMSATPNLNASGVRFYNNIYWFISGRFLDGGAILEGNLKTKDDGVEFVDVGNADFRLAAGSPAIDAGIVIPTITDGYKGSAPDAGALEAGDAMWKYGHDFQNPPNPSYKWYSVPFSNLIANPGFENDLNHWQITKNSPTAIYANTWNYKDVSLGSSGERTLELKPGDEIEQTIDGLEPSTYYKLTGKARVLRKDIQIVKPDASNGTFLKNHFNNEYSITGLNSGEWTSYDNVDFGADKGYFNRLDIGHVGNANLEVRLDSPTGLILANVTLESNTTGLSISSANIPEITGKHSIYLIFNNSMGDLRLDLIRLLNTRSEERVELGVRDFNGANVVSRKIGYSDWVAEEGFIFKTGSSTTSATVFLNKLNGVMNGYAETISLVKVDEPQAAYKGNSIPGTIQAQDFDKGGQGIAYNVVNYSNTKNLYRPDESVLIDVTIDGSGDYHVSNLKSGEWLEYTIDNITSGVYSVELRYAMSGGSNIPLLKLDNESLGSFNVSSTGGLSSWRSVILDNVTIKDLNNAVLRLEVPEGEISINYLKFTKVRDAPSAPSANFSTSSSVVVGSIVQFINTSTNATSYHWTFGDGSTSTLKDPNHTYSSVGTYNVELVATNTIGVSTKSVSISVSALILEPVASFNVNASANVGESVQFSNTSSGAISYLWNFGDGNTSTQASPSHDYTTPGTYSVSLTASNSEGTSLKSTSIIINPVVASPGDLFCTLFANGSYSGEEELLGVGIHNSILLNNQVSSIKVPNGLRVTIFENTNRSGGKYILTSDFDVFRLAFDNGAPLNDNVSSVLVEDLRPVSDFSVSTNASTGESVQFINTSTNATSYNWSFGDGSTSTLKDPDHSYNSIGTYNVELVATNTIGVSTKSVSISVNQIVSPPNGDLSCILFSGGGYSGSEELLSVGLYYTIKLNNEVSSIKVPDGLRVTIFENENLQGGKYELTSDFDVFRLTFDNGMPLNDNVSSVLVEDISKPLTNSCILYEHGSYLGEEEALAVGVYNNIRLNDMVSSIKVSEGLRVTIYENANLNGGKYILTADFNTFRLAFDNGVPLNDNVSSVLVENISGALKSAKFPSNSFVDNGASIDIKVHMWPNPTIDYLHIDLNESVSRVITIYNVQGEKLYSVTEKNDKYIVDVTDFMIGSYVVQVRDSETNEIVTEHFIKRSR